LLCPNCHSQTSTYRRPKNKWLGSVLACYSFHRV
jgi:hypothetical protein